MKRRLQVFISSTYIDLLPERQAAVSAVLKAGHIPAGMELFTSGDSSQLETIKRWIDESDVYMLILGGRYGSVEPTSGISYTELEYDYAVQQKKAFFAVVITENALEKKVRDAGQSALERVNTKELVLFRKKVMDSISSFFDDEKDIKLCVHETLSDFSTNRALKGWVQADEIVDTKPLFDEIKKLTDENNELKNAIVSLESSRTSASEKSEKKFQELIDLLSEIDIKIPENLVTGDDVTVTLLDIFFSQKELLVRGITNQINSTDLQKFLYFNICPKLQIHGLVENEKVAGVTYRRYATTALGISLLAELDKKIVQNKAAPAKKIAAPAKKTTARSTKQ
ncbi:DUF4062 domain-containing protein [Comamonas sp. 26]|uniref:DUF4062 domain-containing protein n=1 Tax=Comamonas sp. 26 TaxID=2035201 RepID=UPI000C19A2B1|nr:DUF4062 domain-containing protein [Comamonas sp. 26]PIG09394.1 uncharacterized protein DUF4062 [Comamonas sp. 26]